MSVGRHMFVEFLKELWKFGKESGEKNRVSRMTPKQRQEWRASQFAEIQKEAAKLTNFMSDADLRKRGTDRANVRRGYEIMLLHDLGVRTSQYLLEGEDIRGLDLGRMKGLYQDQINHAIGDSTTRLPGYLSAPPSWFSTNVPDSAPRNPATGTPPRRALSPPDRTKGTV